MRLTKCVLCSNVDLQAPQKLKQLKKKCIDEQARPCPQQECVGSTVWLPAHPGCAAVQLARLETSPTAATTRRLFARRTPPFLAPPCSMLLYPYQPPDLLFSSFESQPRKTWNHHRSFRSDHHRFYGQPSRKVYFSITMDKFHLSAWNHQVVLQSFFSVSIAWSTGVF